MNNSVQIFDMIESLEEPAIKVISKENVQIGSIRTDVEELSFEKFLRFLELVDVFFFQLHVKNRFRGTFMVTSLIPDPEPPQSQRAVTRRVMFSIFYGRK